MDSSDTENSYFEPLLSFMRKIPSVETNDTPSNGIGRGRDADGMWWIKFSLNIKHHLAWNVVQELGFVLNYISLKERLPTTFKPVSPPPYLNGGPEEFLSWVIECQDSSFTPKQLADTLVTRLPRPVGSLEKWNKNGQ